MIPAVLLPQQLERHVGLAALAHLLLNIGQQGLEFLETLVRISSVTSFQTVLQYRIVQFQKSVNAERVCIGLPYVVVHCLLIHAHLEGCLTVGDVLLLQ